MKIGVVIVLFQPDTVAIKNLEQWIDVADKISVVDNSKNVTLIEIEHFEYIHNANNGGIAGALNRGCDYLFDEGCDFVFTFDQDSILPKNFFSSMRGFIKEKNADIVCPDFIDTNSNTKAKFVKLNKFNFDIATDGKTDFAISSGMGFSRELWNKIGHFDERYIIDHVDTEFCIKAKEANYQIWVNYDVTLEHQIGIRSVEKFLGVTFKPNNHSFMRKYYIVRNGTHLSFKYFLKYPSYFYMNILRLVHEFICVVLYEKGKLKKVKYMFLGVIHSIIGKLGALK